ncbi:MAG: hypothetical protein JWQ32_1454 [Marmoricola sp.]|nr:hypothetical protein [Marmoricola sp.]
MRLQYDDVPLAKGHYESVYFVATHPSEPRALWLRTTVRKRPGQEPVGALWATWYTEDGVRAAKLDGLPISTDGSAITIGAVHNGPGGSTGEIIGDRLGATWDLTFTPIDGGQSLEHLHPGFLYSAPIPRTKPTSPAPNVAIAGQLTIDGTPIDLDGWTGMVGHNWGSQHAARWIWLRAPGLGSDGTGWLDAVLARIRVGPLLTPWTSFGALQLDGARHPLGGLLRRDTAVDLGPDGARITLGGSGLKVVTTARVPLASTVAWKYADPNGHGHEVVNSSVARMTVAVAGADGSSVFEPAQRGVLEVGGDTRAFDVPLQPYDD